MFLYIYHFATLGWHIVFQIRSSGRKGHMYIINQYLLVNTVAVDDMVSKVQLEERSKNVYLYRTTVKTRPRAYALCRGRRLPGVSVAKCTFVQFAVRNIYFIERFQWYSLQHLRVKISQPSLTSEVPVITYKFIRYARIASACANLRHA